jgi:adhesin/invasin
MILVRFCSGFLIPLSTLAAACGGGDLSLPSDPSQIQILRGDDQVGDAGMPLADSVVLRVEDEANRGIADRAVTWVVSVGGGSVTPGTSTTNGDGLASAEWILGPAAGPNSLEARVSGIGTVIFTATANSDEAGSEATSIELIEGDDQRVPVGIKVPVRPAVRVINAAAQPVSGVEVRFVVTDGAGSVSGAIQTTNAEGIARVDSWTLGPSPGPNTLEAHAGSLQGSPVVFTAEGTNSGIDHFVFRVPPHGRGE